MSRIYLSKYFNKDIVTLIQLFLLPDYNKNSINRTIYLYEILDCFDTNWHTNHPMTEWGCHTDNCKCVCKTVDSSTNPYWEEDGPYFYDNTLCNDIVHYQYDLLPIDTPEKIQNILQQYHKCKCDCINRSDPGCNIS